MSWTVERVELLGRLWADGLSASQIAGRLGGVTRNGVVGKVHRLGLPKRVIPQRDRGARRAREAVKVCRHQHVVPAPKRPPAPTRRPPAAVAEIEEPKDLVSTSAAVLALQPAMCRWPFGDPRGEFHGFCGRYARGSYCANHDQMARRPAKRKRERGGRQLAVFS